MGSAAIAEDDREDGGAEKDRRDYADADERAAEAFAGAVDVSFEGADDLEDAADVADLPIGLGAVGVGVVATDATGLHATRRGEAERRTAVHFGEFMIG